MTRDPIFIRVDATSRGGYERYQRCLTLAAALQRRRRPTYFVSQFVPPTLGFTVKRGGNDWINVPHVAGAPDDAVRLVQEIRRLCPAAVIVDEGELTTDYLEEIAATGV